MRSILKFVGSLIFLALLFALSPLAHAGGCIVGDRTSMDKSIHLVGEGWITIMGDSLSGREWVGPTAALAVGAYREVWKTQHGYSCEWSSMAYDLAGIGLGAAVGHHILITAAPHAVAVSYSTKF